MKIHFISSSENKASEISKVLGREHTLERVGAELPEIQSLDSQEIIKHKLGEAKNLFPDEAIIVEDTSLEVDALNGLPGPFIKFFEQTVDDKGIYEMARGIQPKGELTCRAKVVIGLLVGEDINFFEGSVDGKLVEQDGDGWGFDRILIPKGYNERMGVLGPEIKAQISHRALAAQSLKKHLDSIS